jgi:carboxypeptidase family protein
MIAICLLVALQLQPQQPKPADQAATPATATLRGHVFAADSSQPLRRAQVRLTQVDAPIGGAAPAARVSKLATTDGDGKYEFTDLPAGRYNITASKSSYVQVSWGQQRTDEPGKPLQILAGQTVERVDLTLPRGGVITGRVVDEFGEPLSNIQVSAVRNQMMNGRLNLMPLRSSSTNDLGEFRIFALQPGQYYLQATWRRMGPGDPTSPDQIGYPQTFFPGVTDAANAQRFTIAAGQTIADLAMALSPIKTARVEGTLVDSNGRQMSSVGVSLMQLSTNGAVVFGNGAPLRPDGTFVFTNVTPGEYILRTQPRPGEKEAAMMKLTVGSEDIKDIRLIAAPPSTISGRIVVDPAEAQSLPKSVMLMAMPMDMAAGGPMFGPIEPGRLSDDMSFELTAPIGKTRIVANNLPPTWMIRSVRVNSIDVIDDGIDVKANENVTGVEIELTNKTSSVSGLVTNARGEPATDYWLVIFPADGKRWGPGSRYLRVGRPDQDGRFKVIGLPPAEYNAIALDKMQPGQNTDPEFLERIRGRASSFTLLEGETRTIDLKLNSAS